MTSNLIAEIIKRKCLPNIHSQANGLDPLTATDDTLISHGLPKRPNESTQPLYYAQWKQLVTHALKYIPSKSSIVNENVSRPTSQAQDPSSRPTKSGTALVSETWSGAVDSKLDPGESIEHAGATWIVPQLYPSKDPTAKSFDFGLWVGVDGYTRGDGTLLQAGTVHTCTIDPESGNIKKDFFAFYNWYGDNFTMIDDFLVSPGDTIAVFLNYFKFPKLEGEYSEFSDTSWAWIIYLNQSLGTYAVRIVKQPSAETDDKSGDFKADSTEWILDNKDLQYKLAAFGSALIFNCFSITNKGKERTLAASELISMVRDGVCVSQAAIVGDQAVGLTYPRA